MTWRRERDSNPRWLVTTAVFKTAAINRTRPSLRSRPESTPPDRSPRLPPRTRRPADRGQAAGDREHHARQVRARPRRQVDRGAADVLRRAGAAHGDALEDRLVRRALVEGPAGHAAGEQAG